MLTTLMELWSWLVNLRQPRSRASGQLRVGLPLSIVFEAKIGKAVAAQGHEPGQQSGSMPSCRSRCFQIQVANRMVRPDSPERNAGSAHSHSRVLSKDVEKCPSLRVVSGSYTRKSSIRACCGTLEDAALDRGWRCWCEEGVNPGASWSARRELSAVYGDTVDALARTGIIQWVDLIL